MAEETQVKEPLSQTMIEAGAALIDQLFAMGAPVGAALWWWDAGSGEWKLMLGTGDVMTGDRITLDKVDEATGTLGNLADSIPMFGVSLLDARQEPLASLRKYEKSSGRGLANKRIKKSDILGRYVDDAMIYWV